MGNKIGNKKSTARICTDDDDSDYYSENNNTQFDDENYIQHQI